MTHIKNSNNESIDITIFIDDKGKVKSFKSFGTETIEEIQKMCDFIIKDTKIPIIEDVKIRIVDNDTETSVDVYFFHNNEEYPSIDEIITPIYDIEELLP